MAFSEKQYRSIVDANRRINIWDGSVRSGKTIASIIRWAKYVKEAPPDYPLVMTGKTNATLERNIIDPMIQMMGRHRVQYSRGLGQVIIYGRRIACIGAPDERAQERIRGSTLGGMYGDEISLWPDSYFRMALSRLSLPGAKFFGTTNPDSPYHWLKTDYLDREHELDLKRFHFTLDDNPNLDPAYVRELKKEYTGLWFKRFILGLWVLAEGVVYDMWDDDVHAVDPLKGDDGEDRKFKNYFVSCDYGTHNPTVFGLFGYNGKPPAYLLKEYHWDSTKESRQKTDADYADDLKAFIGDKRISTIYVDPSAASFIAELRKRHHHVTPAKNDVVDGIRFVGTMLSAKQFYVYRACKNTLMEFASYVWDANSQKRGVDVPVKTRDHCMDMIRYGLFTHFFKEHKQFLMGFNFK